MGCRTERYSHSGWSRINVRNHTSRVCNNDNLHLPVLLVSGCMATAIPAHEQKIATIAMRLIYSSSGTKSVDETSQSRWLIVVDAYLSPSQAGNQVSSQLKDNWGQVGVFPALAREAWCLFCGCPVFSWKTVFCRSQGICRCVSKFDGLTRLSASDMWRYFTIGWPTQRSMRTFETEIVESDWWTYDDGDPHCCGLVVSILYHLARCRVTRVSWGNPASHSKGGRWQRQIGTMVGVVPSPLPWAVWGEWMPLMQVVRSKFAELTAKLGIIVTSGTGSSWFFFGDRSWKWRARLRNILQRGHDVLEHTFVLRFWCGVRGGDNTSLTDCHDNARCAGDEAVRCFIHPGAGALSACGMGLADVRVIRERVAKAF